MNKSTVNTYILPNLYDLAIIPAAWLLAFCLRFNFEVVPKPIVIHALYSLVFLVGIQSCCNITFGVYRSVWRYTSVVDLLKIFKSTTTAALTTLMLLYLVGSIHNIPRVVIPLYMLLYMALSAGPRLLFRWYNESNSNLIDFDNNQRVLIIGAGQAGEQLARNMHQQQNKIYQPIAFLDDDRKKNGREIQGIRTIGSIALLPTVVKNYNIDLIFIAMPSANSKEMRRIVELCDNSSTPYRTLPSLNALADGRVSLNKLKEVGIEDLLGRDQAELDWQTIQHNVKNQVILITGGAGSIGSELCRQVSKLNPSKVIIIDNSEYNIYQLQADLDANCKHTKFEFYLDSITDKEAIDTVFALTQPTIVFHAAAYKHVPILEEQALSAAKNNLIGTKTIAENAVKHGIKTFVLISTDKAVNPTNVMGLSKRAAEIYCQNLNNQANTNFITVRFGNVLESAGSVIPVFRKQLASGGPITVTHPEITRYFMLTSEACQLILQASAIGQGGEIFVLDMGEPVKIKYLAEQLIKLSGLKPYEDIDIEYIGLRSGEKLYEELLHEQENLLTTPYDKLLKAASRSWDWEELNTLINKVQSAIDAHNRIDVLRVLRTLVPEYNSQQQAEKTDRDNIHQLHAV